MEIFVYNIIYPSQIYYNIKNKIQGNNRYNNYHQLYENTWVGSGQEKKKIRMEKNLLELNAGRLLTVHSPLNPLTEIININHFTSNRSATTVKNNDL